ncbi:sugar phosphate isomerase/epimerase family protein [Paenibacillus cremeus]|uniref:Sugar phosphate isomerase/epimerase n=1 Tax=Paenibacillus cremeus TaxID=2163881 RepID=A0A559KA27_9BACL|nr:sugar phosphate isomerase/epimerase family protein [Paenibacillus cremeus]TVY08974.1 sugar phosphate isomerase/epimerase [Paenibacillus cremeus]
MKLTNSIGIMVDSLRLGLHEGLKKSKELGADGVQIYAVDGEMDPANLTPAARKELKRYIDSLGLQVSALCGDLGGHGFQDKLVNAAKIEKSKRILDLALELGTKVVTTHIGIVPDDENGEVYSVLQTACEELGVYAKQMGAYFAVETGPETAAHLKRFLDSLSTDGVSVNFDPANMVMVTGDDPVQGVYTLKDYIVHTHVKDGIRLREVDPREVYGALGYEPMSHEKIAEAAATGPSYRELALGQGHVDFQRYFQALQDIGYTGYLTIEREVGDQPEHDIAQAIAFIRRFK